MTTRLDLQDYINPKPLGKITDETGAFFPNLQKNAVSFNRKWSSLNQYEPFFGKDITKGIRDYDAARVSQGYQPYTADQTVMALLAAKNLSPATKPPEEHDDWWNPQTWVKGIYHDIVDIGKGLYRLPQTLYDQWKAYSENVSQWTQSLESKLGIDPNTPVARALTAGAQAVTGNPGASLQTIGLTHFAQDPKVAAILANQKVAGEKLKNTDNFWDYPGNLAGLLSSTPGPNLVPGVATASRALPGGAPAGEIAQHPVMTALDILPYKLKLAEASTVGRTAVQDAARAVQGVQEGGEIASNFSGRPVDLTATAARKAANAAFKNVTAAEPADSGFAQLSQKIRERLPVRESTFEKAAQEAYKARVQQLEFPDETIDLPAGPYNRLPGESKPVLNTTEEGFPTFGKNRKDWLADTKVGKTTTKLWGDTVRAFSAKVSDANDTLAIAARGDDAMQGKLPPDILQMPEYKMVRQTRDFLANTAERIGMTPEEFKAHQGELNRLAVEGTAEEVSKLTNEQFNYYLATKDLNDQLFKMQDQLHLNPNTNEVMTPAQHLSFTRRQNMFDKAEGRFNTLTRGEDSLVDKITQKLTDPAKNFDPQAMARWSEVLDYIEGLPHLQDPAKYQNLAKMMEAKFGRVHVTPGAKNVGKYTGDTLMQDITMRNFMRDVRAMALSEKRLHEYRPLPARFQPMVSRKIKETLIQRAPNDEVGKQVLRDFEDRNYAQAYLPDDEMAARVRAGTVSRVELRQWQEKQVDLLARQMENQWEQIRKETGTEPVFLHRVSEGMEKASRRPRVSGVVQKETHVQNRPTLPHDAFYQDVTVGLQHQAFEMLRTRVQQNFADSLAADRGLSRIEAEDKMLPRAEVIATRRRGGLNANNPSAIARDLVDKNYMKLNPKTMFGVERANGWGEADDILVPKVLGETMEKMTKGGKGPIAATIDPVTGLYRLAVTAFRPSTQVNNVLTNIISTALEEPGALRPRNLINAVKAARSATDLLDLTHEILAKNGTAEELIDAIQKSPAHAAYMSEFQQFLKDNSEMLPSDAHALRDLQFMGGRTLRRVLDKFGEWQERAQGLTPEGMSDAQAAAKGAIGKTGQAFMRANGFIDDINRSALYFERLEKNLGRGMSPGVAAEDALALARKTAMNWRAMTPLEREILRPLVPFYAWMQHIIRYAKQYPIDHPIRTELINNLVRVEMGHEKDKPSALQTLLFPSLSKGDRWATGFNLDSINPLQTVASTAGLLGFLTGDSAAAGQAVGNLNPIFGVLLQQLGIDPRSGVADMYPDLGVDPHTGALTIASQNPIENLVLNTVPQVGAVTALLGMRHQQGMDNPSAVTRSIFTSLGIPTGYARRYDVAKAYGTYEVSLENQQKKALNAALKSGDYRAALQWPGLQTTPQDSLYGATLPVFLEMQKQGIIPVQRVQTPTQRVMFATKMAADSQQIKALQGS